MRQATGIQQQFNSLLKLQTNEATMRGWGDQPAFESRCDKNRLRGNGAPKTLFLIQQIAAVFCPPLEVRDNPFGTDKIDVGGEHGDQG